MKNMNIEQCQHEQMNDKQGMYICKHCGISMEKITQNRKDYKNHEGLKKSETKPIKDSQSPPPPSPMITGDERIVSWTDANLHTPDNCFQLAVLMWNPFNDSYEYGIGIYDVPTKKWEITPLEGDVVYNVRYWFKLPDIITKH